MVGEPGSGKSALLADWGLRFRAAHSAPLTVLHFVGATPSSTDWAAMLRRILAEFQRQLGIDLTIPEDHAALRVQFANGLHLAAAQRRVVLVLDGLDQLEDRDGAGSGVAARRNPGQRPAGRVDVARPPAGGPATTRLADPGGPAAGRGRAARAGPGVLAAVLQQLDRPRLDRIVAAPPAANPLYLRALLEELRLVGLHEQLDRQIGHYLAAPDAVDLYQKILQRYEEDYDGDRPGWCAGALVLLWAARRGLAEVELLELLGNGDGPLPHAYWTPLLLALEASLLSRSGLLNFFHGQLRQAVRAAVLAGRRRAAGCASGTGRLLRPPRDQPAASGRAALATGAGGVLAAAPRLAGGPAVLRRRLGCSAP